MFDTSTATLTKTHSNKNVHENSFYIIEFLSEFKILTIVDLNEPVTYFAHTFNFPVIFYTTIIIITAQLCIFSHMYLNNAFKLE